mmetsp:Transcript_646/g.1066  ORF Transcript_646/g.1066 Transcript_646/m.1066 type:complete len:241 (+) Transcript_646:51-773(+)
MRLNCPTLPFSPLFPLIQRSSIISQILPPRILLFLYYACSLHFDCFSCFNQLNFFVPFEFFHQFIIHFVHIFNDKGLRRVEDLISCLSGIILYSLFDILEVNLPHVLGHLNRVTQCFVNLIDCSAHQNVDGKLNDRLKFLYGLFLDSDQERPILIIAQANVLKSLRQELLFQVLSEFLRDPVHQLDFYFLLLLFKHFLYRLLLSCEILRDCLLGRILQRACDMFGSPHPISGVELLCFPS